MKSNKFKKISALFYIVVFLFVFSSFNEKTSAQEEGGYLSIFVDKYIFEVGQEINVKGVSNVAFGGEKIIFSILKKGEPISKLEYCTIPYPVVSSHASENPPNPNQLRDCSVSFNAESAGTYYLDGSVTVRGYQYSQPLNVEITVKEKPVPNTPKCEEGERLNASNQCAKESDTIYDPLAKIPGTGLGEPIDTSQSCAFGNYLNILIKIIIGFSAVLAMIMIVMGGIEYMTSEMVSEKQSGKDTIQHALLGLLLALGSYALLNTLNPALLNACLNLKDVYITIDEEGEEMVGDPAVICGKKTKLNNGQEATSCDESQMQTISFMGKTVKVNKLIVSDLMVIDATWKASTDPKIRSYQILDIGGFSNRSATGTSSTPSAHAFGLAIDINPRANPFVNSKTECPTDMPRAFVELFTRRGFGWGGFWESKKDAMHFSKKGNESATTGTCSGLIR